MPSTGQTTSSLNAAVRRPLRVAVVGAGPAGLYAAQSLTDQSQVQVSVDLIERLPAPFGLLRYGVAPDHLKIKSTGAVMHEVLERPEVRLFANVALGTDLTVDELREAYDAVMYALGASADRVLGIPGEDLPGSESATEFVSWYNGHPDRVARDILDDTHVAVIGAGNVAIDVARLLLKEPAELEHTDIPQDVLEVLRNSAVTDVHIVARRAPHFAKFTSKELRELGDLPNVDVILGAEQLTGSPDTGLTPNEKRNLAIMAEWSARAAEGRHRRLHLHFRAVPRAMLGDTHVTGMRLERADDNGVGTGDTFDLDVQLVLRSVGYRALAIHGLPFDPGTNTIPTVDHRVMRDGVVSPGEYAVGWIKRGPTGVLGTNRKDASETAANLLADAAQLLGRRDQEPHGIGPLLAQRGIRHIDLQRWLAIVDAEAEAGVPYERGRVKLAEWDKLLEAAALLDAQDAT